MLYAIGEILDANQFRSRNLRHLKQQAACECLTATSQGYQGKRSKVAVSTTARLL
jgi:hypothetical protein